MTPGTRHTNRLANETSPYLLQHAHNPVDWWPWGPDALARAKILDRPIFLSIGYAACHWCHVMERESFEDEATARFLNERFIAIKVDREERPEIDQIYMAAVQAMTGQGGWPMSVFLTPEGRPFFGGTYFPNEPRHGMPSFRQVLEGIEQAWRQQRNQLEQSGSQLVNAIVAQQKLPTGDEPGKQVLDEAIAQLERMFDPRNGSWGGAPKFPQPMTLEFLIRRVAGGDPRGAAMVQQTLDKMASGGIHDQLGGGFHRYATDAIWLVPHFEQMLYDNAQLARVYTHAWRQFGTERYREVAEGVLDYMDRELSTADGAFAASQDADTEGEEGKTFTWSASEIREALGDDAQLFIDAYGVTDNGNWEGLNILARAGDPGAYRDPATEQRLAEARRKLLDQRAKRAQPARDDKVLAAWNGLAIAAFANASALPDGQRYAERAVQAAEAVLGGLRTPEGRLKRSWKDGRATGDGVLEDYANLATGMLALYAATFDERWFTVARALADTMLAHFADRDGGFFDTADDHERLITRPKDLQDNAVPAGNSAAATVLLELAALTGDGKYRTAAERALRLVTAFASRYPTGFANWLSAIDFALADVIEIAVVGEPGIPDVERLLSRVREGYRPNQVVAVGDPESSVVPLLGGRVAIANKATAFVCRNFACRQPVTEPEALAAQLHG